MKRTIKWVVVLLVVGGLSAVGYASYRRSAVLQVRTVTPERGTLITYVEDTGKVRLDRWQTVHTRVSGLLGKVALEPGDAVKAGQEIARIEDTHLRKAIDKAKSSIAEIRARIEGLDATVPRKSEIEQARIAVNSAEEALEIERRKVGILEMDLAQVDRELLRLQTLSTGGVSPKADLERLQSKKETLCENVANQRTAVRIQELQLKASRQKVAILEERTGDTEPARKAYAASMESIGCEIDVLERDRSWTVIRAPFDGVVLERHTRGDVWCAPGTPVLRIGDISSLEVEVDLLSDDLPRVALGRRALVTGKSISDRQLEGTVAKIHPEAFTKISSLGIEQQRVKVVIRFAALPPGLTPGVSVDVKIEADRAADTWKIPEKSVYDRDGKSYVFVIQGGVLVEKEIVEGLSDDDFVEVLSGLEPTDEVVLSPDNDMAPGCEAVRMTEKTE